MMAVGVMIAVVVEVEPWRTGGVSVGVVVGPGEHRHAASHLIVS